VTPQAPRLRTLFIFSVTILALLHALLPLFSSSPVSQASAPSSLYLDGESGYAEVADSLSLGVPLNLTVESWINPSEVTARRPVVAKGPYQLAVEPAGQGVRALFGVSRAGTWHWVASDELALGEWHHIAGTYDGVTMRLFTNGAAVGSTWLLGALDGIPGPLRIGTADATDDFFHGLVDEVRVSNVVRYATGFSLPTTPFVPDLNTQGLWHFDEGVGTTTDDASGNGNVAVPQGGWSWTASHTTPGVATPTRTPTRTPTPTGTASGQCPCSLWDNGDTPTQASSSDQNAAELGVKFRSSVAGHITGIRFYKGTANTGTHRASLWNAAGTKLAGATFSGETASGWQQVNFAAPVAIAANTTYVASYHAPVGRYAYNESYFTSGRRNGPLTAPASSTAGGNGVYRYGASGFPNSTYRSANYWVDPVFVTSASPATPTPPATLSPTRTATRTPTPVDPASTPIPTATRTATGVPPASTSTPTATRTATPVPPASTATFTPTRTPTPQTGPVQAGHTQVEALQLASTYQSVSVYANFANDDGDNRATLEYRPAGASAWTRGMDMTVDRRANVTGNGTFANPFRDQWRASLLMLSPGTTYEVRVTFSDPDGVAGTNPVVGTVRTRAAPPAATGTTYHVAATGSDTNPGTAAAPFRTLQKAADTAQAGNTVLVGAGTYAAVSLSRSGTAANWIHFQNAPGARPLVSGSGGVLVRISGSFVRFSGFEIAGGQWGVRVFTPAHDVVVENNLIRGQRASGQEGVAVEIGDTFSQQNPVANVTVQDNDIRADTLPEPESNVILAKAASGGHVIRRNRIVFFYQGGNVHGTDCIGGLPNFDPHGGFFKDTDVNDNYCEGATDEGVEIDGGNANVRVWGNTIVGANIGFSITPVHYGPVYVFRNVVYALRDHWIGSCLSVKDGETGTGAVFFYHNTFHAPVGSACANSLKGFAKYGSGGSQTNVTVKNNILHHWGRAHETGPKTFDGNLSFVEPASGDKYSEWGGTNYFSFDSFRSGTGQEANGRYGKATFLNAASGDYRLAAGSLGVDDALPIPAFNGPGTAWPTLGAGPDIGAHESR
jgi:hypothetical protein